MKPLENRLYPESKFTRAERFDHIIISAQGEAGHSLLFGRLGGDHDDRDITLGFKVLEKFLSRDIRQHEIEDNQVRFFLPRRLKGGKPLTEMTRREPRALDIGFDDLGDLRVILDDEDCCRQGKTPISDPKSQK